MTLLSQTCPILFLPLLPPLLYVCSMPLPKHKVPLCWEYSFFLCPSTSSYLLRPCHSFCPLCAALLDHDSTTDGELIILGAGQHFIFYLLHLFPARLLNRRVCQLVSVPALLLESRTMSCSSLVSWGSSAIVHWQQEHNGRLMNYMINRIQLLWKIAIPLSLRTVKNTQRPQILWKYFQWINLWDFPMADIKEPNWY